jgi:hypothetical protein
MFGMNDVVKVEQVANPLEINKDRLREWSACASSTNRRISNDE